MDNGFVDITDICQVYRVTTETRFLKGDSAGSYSEVIEAYISAKHWGAFSSGVIIGGKKCVFKSSVNERFTFKVLV